VKGELMSQDPNMTPNAPQQKTARQAAMKPWVRGLLLLSLALNLAVLGMVAGAYFRFGGPDSDKRPARTDQIAGAYTRALAPEDRRSIWRDMRKQSAQMPSRAEMRRTHAQVLALLRADPLDTDALASALGRQIEFGHARAELGQMLLVKHLSGMTAADRAAYADRLEDALKKRKPDHKDRGAKYKRQTD
jgi:uncharacterized membrane protein